MGKAPSGPGIGEITSARRHFSDADEKLGDALQRCLVDLTGTRTDALEAFVRQQDAFHAYSGEVLTRIGSSLDPTTPHESPKRDKVRRADPGR
ncbi:MAG: hypothetical protein OEV00_00780 [Acidobacteriota bacterium]|nr:hypothetical protein [Acidobacteriota bacterium]MDH3783839.1 hypothetical protein [Acidobacteriota bacterium]